MVDTTTSHHLARRPRGASGELRAKHCIVSAAETRGTILNIRTSARTF